MTPWLISGIVPGGVSAAPVAPSELHWRCRFNGTAGTEAIDDDGQTVPGAWLADGWSGAFLESGGYELGTGSAFLLNDNGDTTTDDSATVPASLAWDWTRQTRIRCVLQASASAVSSYPYTEILSRGPMMTSGASGFAVVISDGWVFFLAASGGSTTTHGGDADGILLHLNNSTESGFLDITLSAVAGDGTRSIEGSWNGGLVFLASGVLVGLPAGYPLRIGSVNNGDYSYSNGRIGDLAIDQV
jgi:hypothetical protein